MWIQTLDTEDENGGLYNEGKQVIVFQSPSFTFWPGICTDEKSNLMFHFPTLKRLRSWVVRCSCTIVLEVKLDGFKVQNPTPAVETTSLKSYTRVRHLTVSPVLGKSVQVVIVLVVTTHSSGDSRVKSISTLSLSFFRTDPSIEYPTLSSR